MKTRNKHAGAVVPSENTSKNEIVKKIIWKPHRKIKKEKKIMPKDFDPDLVINNRNISASFFFFPLSQRNSFYSLNSPLKIKNNKMFKNTEEGKVSQ